MLPKYLGGHLNVTHIDMGAFRYLARRYQPKTFLDVGCGPGGMVRNALSYGLNAHGIDGDYTLQFKEIDDRVLVHDFTTGPCEVAPADLGWCVEFLEHIEEQFLPNVFSALGKCNVILCTANPTIAGHHHVNCQPQSYWIATFSRYGFLWEEEATEHVRDCSDMVRDFVRDTGLVFRKEGR